MTKIATNIYEQLSKDQINEIANFAKDIFGTIQITEYITKSPNASDTPRFILDGFGLRGASKNPKIWSEFNQIIIKLTSIAKEKNISLGVQFWIQDKEQKPPINISFSILEGGVDIDRLLGSLEVKIQKGKNKYLAAKGNSIIWLAYDHEKDDWKETIL